MTEKVGRIEKPPAERFKQSKKLYLIPLIYSNEGAPDEYKEKYGRYWQQASEQLVNLEAKIGKVRRVYHELISQYGEDGLKLVEGLNPDSYKIAKSKCDNGAILEAVEEEELVEEVMDWERCMMLGLVSKRVASKISEFYFEASGKRYEFMTKKLEETLKDNEAGLLFITEGHRLQFPAGIEVFSVFPPALDEIHRWLRDRSEKKQKKAQEEEETEE
mgnify:CR=1 FL=1